MELSSKKLVLINTNIITLEPHFPHASWLAVENGKFVALGYGEDWKNFRHKSATIIDCAGKTVLPGFIDAHLHLVSYAKSFVTLDLSLKQNVLVITPSKTLPANGF
jgi:predicted amidohydrolase YtcJ